jgi:hypothetical protein
MKKCKGCGRKRYRVTGPKAQREGFTGIALLFLDLGARREWVVSTTTLS